jgi:tetratricopeptide (TPR) repeat protein
MTGEPMTASATVAQGWESYERQAWRQAYDQLLAADRAERLEPEDLERLATAAYLLGLDADSADLLARAYHDHLGNGAVERAARCAFLLAFGLLFRGETARGGGWLTRAERLLAERQDCAEHGFLLVSSAYQSWDDGDPIAAHATFMRAAALGERFGERDLITLAGLGQGQTLIAQGKIAEGVAVLDEAMVAVTADEVSPIVVGLVYCAVIDACKQIFDLRRAHEWTAALSQWCAGQPDLVPYRGQCLVHRAEIMQLHGAWVDAMDEARRARDRLADPPSQPAVGAAFYQLAELHRLRGEWAQAEEAYGQASQWGHSPQPGLALLRLGQGYADAAAATIRRVVAEAEEGPELAHVLPASWKSGSRWATSARPARPRVSSRRSRPSSTLRCCVPNRQGLPVPSPSPKVTQWVRSTPCGEHGRPGRSWMLRTKRLEYAFCSAVFAGSLATRTVRRASWMPHARSSNDWMPRRSWLGWNDSLGERQPRTSAC